MDYSKVLSKTAVSLKPSGIRKFFDLLGSMTDVVALTVGQPDFPTPWHIREAGIESLEKGMTYYTSNAGTEELRNEISAYMLRRFSLKYDAMTETMVTVGGSEAIDVAIRAIVEPGDEVIIPTPSFVCYEPIVRLVGGTPVILTTERKDQFKLNPEKLKSLITPKTKMLVLPFPNNPTGAIMTREELAEIADILRDTNIVVLSDEIYAELTYGVRHVSITALPDMWERTILVNGFSKSYAMTGWRMGFLCAPAPILKQMLKIHQFAIMCAPTTSQIAATEALRNGDADIARMAAEYDRRRKYIHEGLRNIGLDAFEPRGAFYIFPSIGEFGISGDEFCEKLLYNYRCAIVPGQAFGESGEGFARISYAYSVKHITSALERIDAFVTDLKKGNTK
ncbi:MAG: aminotransferase class I/II-fold pyridoxal phosphate-dependent enzyme [Clostridia bacterium]|nr:aminotransferase class I/II-fold pyridoxal phosphate-dependent enzyme [Clostridia bacterium]